MTNSNFTENLVQNIVENIDLKVQNSATMETKSEKSAKSAESHTWDVVSVQSEERELRTEQRAKQQAELLQESEMNKLKTMLENYEQKMRQSEQMMQDNEQLLRHEEQQVFELKEENNETQSELGKERIK